MREKLKIEGIIRGFKMPDGVGDKELNLVRKFVRSKDFDILNDLFKRGVVLGFDEKKNIIVTAGRTVLAEVLAGGGTYTGEINYGALGTGTTPPVNADTQLETEVFRKIASSQAFDNNIAFIDFFYTATDVSGTFEEFGNFIDGTATANSGQLFSHILTGGWVKSSSESLFVSCQYTIN